jgi:hypothetical protein
MRQDQLTNPSSREFNCRVTAYTSSTGNQHRGCFQPLLTSFTVTNNVELPTVSLSILIR